MHPVIILLAVAAGGTLFGIPGAFLAVPVAASVVVALRYLSEQIDLRTGDLIPEDLKLATPEGAITAHLGVEAARRTREELERAGAQEDVLGHAPQAAPQAEPAAAVPGRSWLAQRLHRRRRRAAR